MVKIVGIGPGNKKYLTMEAIETIKSAKDVVSFGRVGQSLSTLSENMRSVARVDELLDTVTEETVVLASGDPCFYGVTDYLIRNGIDVETVSPGISSLQYMMCKLKRGYQNMETLSFHGREMDIRKFQKGNEYFVLTDSKNSPDVISRKLYESGYRGRITVGKNLSYEDEEIICKRIGAGFEKADLAVVVIEIEMD